MSCRYFITERFTFSQVVNREGVHLLGGGGVESFDTQGKGAGDRQVGGVGRGHTQIQGFNRGGGAGKGAGTGVKGEPSRQCQVVGLADGQS